MLATSCVLSFVCALGEPATAVSTVYVSPAAVAGGDGLSAARPVCTLAAARDVVRAKRAAGERGAIRVVVGQGVYSLNEPLVLTPEDSGSVDAPVVWAAKTAGTVVISGGVKLEAWKQAELNGKAVWAAKVPAGVAVEVDGGPAFRSLWVKGTRRTWARYPNGGAFAKVEAVPERPAGDWTVGPTSFAFAAKDSAAWKEAVLGAEVTTFTRWIDSHLRVSSVEEDKRFARFATANMISLEPGDLYFIEGAAGLLDEPGEWWCDAKTRTVFMMPMPGDRLEDAEAVVPVQSSLLRVMGDCAKGGFVEHVKFEGLTFANARWWFAAGTEAERAAKKSVGFMQAAAGAPAAVVCEGARHVSFESCTVRDVEAYGLDLGRGCGDCRVIGCTVSGLGAGAIRIGETVIRTEANDLCTNNVVEDCTLKDGGRIHHQAVGVWIGQSAGNRLAHNFISEFDYTGISIGWTWGYGPSAAGGNVVEWNEVANLGARPGNAEPPLGDMAGIYTLGTQSGTVIGKNYFHDIAGHSIAWGIYFDEGSTGIVAEGNVVLRTTHGGFHQHYGKDNLVRGNLFVDGRDAALWRTRREDHNSFTLENNVVVGASTPWLSGDWSSGFVTRRNLYWRRGGEAIVFPDGRTFEAWQKDGNDAGSVVIDPMLRLEDPRQPRFGAGVADKLKKAGWGDDGSGLPNVAGVGPRVR